MIDRICVFEDPAFRGLLPLVFTRPVYDLRCGILTLRQKIERRYGGTKVHLHVRAYLADLVRQQNPAVAVNSLDGAGCLFLNGRLVASTDLVRQIPLEGPDMLYMAGQTLVAARTSGAAYGAVRGKIPETISASAFGALPKTEVNATVIGYPWDLIKANEERSSRIFRFSPPVRRSA
jgi:hypothetical protein